MTDKRPVFDPAEVRRTLRTFTRPGDVFDIQCRSVTLRGWKHPGLYQGWFDDIDAAIRQLQRVVAHKGTAVQFNAHTLNPELLHRGANVLERVQRGDESTSEADVQRRRWIMVDLDPKRVSGISSSDEELELAAAKAREIINHLADHNFPAPFVCRSGNGIHILYACDLANTNAVRDVLKDLLAELHERFDDEHVEVDRGVYTADTRLKVYGTITCKGADSEERPHRYSRILSGPAEVEIVGLEDLEAYIAPRRAQAVTRSKARWRKPIDEAGEGAFDLVRDIIGHPDVASNILKTKRAQGGDFDTTWVLKTCPACQAKKKGIASISLMASGAYTAACKRSSCTLDGDWIRDRYAPRSYSRASNHPALRGVGNGERREERPSGPPVADVPEDSSTEQLEAMSQERRQREQARWTERPTQLQVAERVLREIDGAGTGVVFDEGGLWRYHAGAGCWRQVSDDAFKRVILKWDREECGSGRGGRPERFEASVQICRDALKTAHTLTGHPGFFERERRGFAVRGSFIHADVESGEVYVIDGSHEHRARAAIDCEYVPWPKGEEEPDPRLKMDLLSQYLSTVHGSAAPEYPEDATDAQKVAEDERVKDVKAKIRLMGEVIFSALCGLGPYYNKAFLAYGPQGTGKSQWLAMLSHLIPEEVQAHIQPHSIGQEYYAAKLAGKRLNVVTECDEGSVMKEAGFKAVVSGEPISARHIRDSVFDFRPVALHLFAGNSLPPAPGATDAMWIRWLPVGFTHRFRGTGKQVKDIGRKIATRETEALVSWAIECGKGLLARGSYTIPPSTEALFAEWRIASDNVAVWLDSAEGVSVGNEDARSAWPKASVCYKRYREWCSDNGFRPVNSRTFTRRLLSIEPPPGGTPVEIAAKVAGYRRINLVMPEFAL